MEANKCDINHLDADLLLPPRKRLLAGLKRHHDGRYDLPSTSGTVSQFDLQLSQHLKTHGDKSPEEIVEAARSAIEAAVKVAKAARAAAEEKAVVAAEAIAAAKRALALVYVYSEEIDSDGECMKTNKMKRHGSDQMLHNKKRRVDADEEVARNLHRAINSSPRVINQNSSSSVLGSYEDRRLMKSSRSLEKRKYCYGGKMDDVDHSSTSNGIGRARELDSGGSNQGRYVAGVDEKTLGKKVDHLKIENSKAVRTHPQGKMVEALEDPLSFSRKREKIKTKKLSSSICNVRDQVNPNDELKYRSLSLNQHNVSQDTASSKPLFSVGNSSSSGLPIERTPIWKCTVFKAPTCVKQSKVMQS